MPWQNNGDYYSFKQESILQHAPTVSGAYGLFNFRHQIVIASAANIRNALLHHRQHTKFRFSRFEPTGFTFEICPAERRENRAQELSREFSPISSPQTPIGIATLYRSWRAPEARAFKAVTLTYKKPVNNDAVVLPAKPAKAKAPFKLNFEQCGLAGALCGVIFLSVGLIGLVPHLKNMFDTIVRNPTGIAKSPRRIDDNKIQIAQAEISIATENEGKIEVAAAPGAAVQSPPVDINANATANSTTGWRSAATQAVSPAPVAATKPATAANEKPAKHQRPSNAWSVQAMATTDKQLADDWLQKLKAEGYDAFLITAAINGNTWHRVRIGTFETPEEAQNLRAVLKSKDGFRDAFVAANDKPSTTVALNPR